MFITKFKSDTKMLKYTKFESCILRLPTEILFGIFSLLPAKHLIVCRQVCINWRNVVDMLVKSDMYWQKHCKEEYTDCYKEAVYKAHPELTWCKIYRSLTLWSKLLQADVRIETFAHASRYEEYIRGCKVLKEGYIAVLKRSGVYYYDIETLKLSNRKPLLGSYKEHSENQDITALLDNSDRLLISQKTLRNHRSLHESKENTDANFKVIGEARSFILADREIYYVNYVKEIFLFKNNKIIFIGELENGVMSFSYTDTINVLTYNEDIYTIKNNRLILSCPHKKVLDRYSLSKYKLLDSLHWFHWDWALSLDGRMYLRGIKVVKTYSDMVFVACNNGTLLIFHDPYVNGVLDLISTKPILEYNLGTRIHNNTEIRHIEVVEKEDGHILIVAMPKKIAAIHLDHKLSDTKY